MTVHIRFRWQDHEVTLTAPTLGVLGFGHLVLVAVPGVFTRPLVVDLRRASLDVEEE